MLFLIEQDTSDKGTIPMNRRELTLLPSPEMVLDRVRQMQEVETPGHIGSCKIPLVSGKAEEEYDSPGLMGDKPREGTLPLQKPHLPAQYPKTRRNRQNCIQEHLPPTMLLPAPRKALFLSSPPNIFPLGAAGWRRTSPKAGLDARTHSGSPA